MSDGSITRWCKEFARGSETAAGELWCHYFDRLVRLARCRLGGRASPVGDEEDVALSAFKSFWRGLREGRFQQLSNRTDIWRLLMVITTRKALDQLAHQQRKKRSADQVVRDNQEHELTQAICHAPTPELEAQASDTLQHLLDQLQLPDLKQIALLKLEGHTNAEVAQLLGRGTATIERKLRTIRALWEQAP
ncbi:MAG: ECF-type sigma factor [Gemmataceae bacterium]